jgi:DNA (cytosine-5)-methyltransferase 1
MHKFHYKWTLADAVFTKDKGKVFSCFACGGGSTMGYKLAGYDVIGFNEIDPKLAAAYIENHKPKYAFIEPIQSFKNREDLPADLYDLDILDGSPPCSSFSMAGNREKDWGKDKHFREGQAKQVLDTLFFDFIDLAKKLQPKVVIAENVEGLTKGKAKKYLVAILQELDDAGYVAQFQVLDAAEMGVPQKRKRVFIFGLRKDLANLIPQQVNLFTTVPILNLVFSEREIPFSEIDTNEVQGKICDSILQLYDAVAQGANFGTAHPKGNYFSLYKAHYNKPLPTIAGVNQPQSNIYHPHYKRAINDVEMILGSSFPTDFNFGKVRVLFTCAMSVPPIMIAQIASEIHTQWLAKM